MSRRREKKGASSSEVRRTDTSEKPAKKKADTTGGGRSPALIVRRERRQSTKHGLMQPTPFTPGERGARHDGFAPSSATPCAVPCSEERGRAGPFACERRALGPWMGHRRDLRRSICGERCDGYRGAWATPHREPRSAVVSTPRRTACVVRQPWRDPNERLTAARPSLTVAAPLRCERSQRRC